MPREQKLLILTGELFKKLNFIEEQRQIILDSPALTNFYRLRGELEPLRQLKDNLMRNTTIRAIQVEKNKAGRNIQIANRIYVPEQYAGLSIYGDKNKFMIATHGMEPCVGVSFYCKELKVGVVIHLDSEQKNTSHLVSYFDKLIQAMDTREKKFDIKVVLSSSPHDGLDFIVDEAIKQVLQQHTTATKETYRARSGSACLVLNLENGDVYTNYEEEGIKIGVPLFLALNASENFRLFHLRDGDIYEQPLHDTSIVYQIISDASSIMLPQDLTAQQKRDSVLHESPAVAAAAVSDAAQPDVAIVASVASLAAQYSLLSGAEQSLLLGEKRQLVFTPIRDDVVADSAQMRDLVKTSPVQGATAAASSEESHHNQGLGKK